MSRWTKLPVEKLGYIFPDRREAAEKLSPRASPLGLRTRSTTPAGAAARPTRLTGSGCLEGHPEGQLEGQPDDQLDILARLRHRSPRFCDEHRQRGGLASRLLWVEPSYAEGMFNERITSF